MTSPPRPTPRPVLLERSRRLAVQFYTSSIQKYVQAKVIFKMYGLELTHFRHERPYGEREDLTTRELLALGLEEVLDSVGARSLFFIEDTSLRIDAISTDTRDVPGLRVKQWFASTSFEELDRQLSRDPAGRRANVRSDIALHVPGLQEPVYFHGDSSGTIAPSAPTFAENPHYPWLTPHSFNGWFVPDGASVPLGAMSFDEAWRFDFRVRSLAALVSRLEEYAAVANVSREVTVQTPTAPAEEPTLTLFGESSGRVLAVVGSTCSGKTTFALNMLQRLPDVTCIEASAVLRSSRKTHDRSDPLEFARRVMREEGPDVVARRVLRMYDLAGGGDFVITGLRTIEEVLLLRQKCPSMELVLVQASTRTRYARHIARSREDRLDYRGFIESDQAQWKFGLLRVANEFSEYRIANEGSLADYAQQVDAVLARSETAGVTLDVRPRHRLSVHRLYRCLDILAESGIPLSCDEIEAASCRLPRILRGQEAERSTGRRYTGKLMLHNNVNKVLKDAPELAERLESSGQRVRYAITPAGHAFLKMMELCNASSGRGT